MRWLATTEPGGYGFVDLAADGTTEWTGVRNHADAGHLRAMAVGDDVLVSHNEKAVVGTATVIRTSQADGANGQVSVALTAGPPLPRPAPLAAMKADAAFAAMAMLRQRRLSVCPVTEHEWATVLRLAMV